MKKLGLVLAAILVSGATLSSATFAQDHRHGAYHHRQSQEQINEPSGADVVQQPPFSN
jgi:hypothetical protein